MIYNRSERKLKGNTHSNRNKAAEETSFRPTDDRVGNSGDIAVNNSRTGDNDSLKEPVQRVNEELLTTNCGSDNRSRNHIPKTKPKTSSSHNADRFHKTLSRDPRWVAHITASKPRREAAPARLPTPRKRISEQRQIFWPNGPISKPPRRKCYAKKKHIGQMSSLVYCSYPSSSWTNSQVEQNNIPETGPNTVVTNGDVLAMMFHRPPAAGQLKSSRSGVVTGNPTSSKASKNKPKARQSSELTKEKHKNHSQTITKKNKNSKMKLFRTMNTVSKQSQNINIENVDSNKKLVKTKTSRILGKGFERPQARCEPSRLSAYDRRGFSMVSTSNSKFLLKKENTDNRHRHCSKTACQKRMPSPNKCHKGRYSGVIATSSQRNILDIMFGKSSKQRRSWGSHSSENITATSSSDEIQQKQMNCIRRRKSCQSKFSRVTENVKLDRRYQFADICNTKQTPKRKRPHAKESVFDFESKLLSPQSKRAKKDRPQDQPEMPSTSFDSLSKAKPVPSKSKMKDKRLKCTHDKRRIRKRKISKDLCRFAQVKNALKVQREEKFAFSENAENNKKEQQKEKKRHSC